MLDSTTRLLTAALLAGLVLANAAVYAAAIPTIRTTYDDGATVTEVTGIVVQDLSHMGYHHGRFHIQDAVGGDYSGIVVLDAGGTEGTLVTSVHVGDQVTLTNVTFGQRDTFGNDTLHFTPGTSGFTFTQGASLPDFTIVSASDIWDGYTAAQGAPYQSMRLMVEDVTISRMDLGPQGDNYELMDGNGDVFWAADYTNRDKWLNQGGWSEPYHDYSSPDPPYGGVDQHYMHISGILEAKRGGESPDEYDFYQLLTWDSNSFLIPEPSSMMLLLWGVALLVCGRWRRARRTTG